MKKLENDIEKRLKDSFENQDFEIQDAWLSDMSEKLDAFNEKPKRRFGFWLFFGALLLGGVSSAYFYNNFNKGKNTETISEAKLETESSFENKENNTKPASTKSTFTYVEEKCLEVENISSKTENLASENNKSKQNRTNSERKEQTNNSKNTNLYAGNKPNKNVKDFPKKETSKNNSNTVNNSGLNGENDLKNKTKNSSSEKTKPNFSTSESEKFAHNEQNGTQKTDNNIESKNINTSATINTANKAELSTKESANFAHNEQNETQKVEINTKNEVKQTSESANFAHNIENALTTKNDSLLADLPKIENVLLADSLLSKTPEKDKKETEPKKNFNLSLAVSAGPSFVFRNYNSTSQNEKRATEENYKVTWNANLELYNTFANKLILGIGIQATNYGEKINYSSVPVFSKDTSFVLRERNGFDVKIVQANHTFSFDTTAGTYTDTIFSIVEKETLDASVTKANGVTNFTYLEIPILIGYKILDTKKFDINATTGVSVGFLINEKGQYISTENTLNTAQNNKLTFNFLLNAQLNYLVAKNVNVMLSPQFKYNLNNQSVFADTKKRYFGFGINAGVVVAF